MQPERMNLTQTLMFYFICVRNAGIMTYFVPYIDMTPPIYVAGMLCDVTLVMCAESYQTKLRYFVNIFFLLKKKKKYVAS